MSAHRLVEQRRRKSKKLTDLIEYAQLSWGMHDENSAITYIRELPSIANTLVNHPNTNYIMWIQKRIS